jgi:hypothetical protein
MHPHLTAALAVQRAADLHREAAEYRLRRQAAASERPTSAPRCAAQRPAP